MDEEGEVRRTLRGVDAGELVGRHGEVRVLVEAARAVADGVGGCVHIVGEAGIGKTSLLAVAADELGRYGVETKAAAAYETDHRRPMGLVRALLPAAPPDAIDAVERLAVAGPVALLADDLHWADDGSLELLSAVARRTEALGVLLVTAARPQAASTALGRLEAALPRTGRRLVPRPLERTEVAELVAARLGSPPGPALAGLLADATGNPFLAVELAVALAEEDRLAVRDDLVELREPETGAMPGHLVERLAGRTLRAVPGGELVLRAIAGIPGGLTVDEIAALLDQPLGELVAVTLAAIDAAVLVDTGSTLIFRHELLRRAVLESTPPSIVRSLRQRVSALLIEGEAAPERIAACLLAGESPPDGVETTRLLTVGRSMRARNPGVAADLLGRALQGIGPDDTRSLPLTLELGWALTAAGRASAVGPLLRDRVGDLPGPMPIALLRLESVALSLSGRLGEASARWEGIGPAELSDQFDPDDTEVVDAAAELAFLRLTSGRLEEAAQLIAWVEASPAPRSAFREAAASIVRGWLAGAAGAFEQGAELARAALRAIAGGESLVVTATSPTLALGVALDNLGDSEGALAVLRPQPPHPPHRPGGAGGSPLLQFGVALVRFRQGEWDDALAEAEAGLLAAEETGLHLGAFWACSIGALVNGARGDLDEARRWLGRSHALSPRGEPGMEWLLYATATLHEAEGDVGSAAAILDAIAQALIEARAPALLLTGAPDMVRLAVITGRTEHAARVVAELDAMTRRTASPVVAAVARWTRALVDESQDPDHAGNSDNSGDADRADRADRSNAIEAAADQLAARGRLPEAARAWHDAAVYAVRRGRSREGRRLATRAFEVYDRLGAHHWHRRLRSDLRAHDVVMRPRRGPPRPSYGWESLTASESAIVDLAGQGLTNTEIAARLFVSRRTVESHLGRIYTKLGLSSRAQLVAAIARRRAERGG